MIQDNNGETIRMDFPMIWLAFFVRALTYKATCKSEDWSLCFDHAQWARETVGNDMSKVYDLAGCCRYALTLKSYVHMRPLIHGVTCALELIVLRGE